MPLDEFWHGDMRLLEAYQKAYYRDKNYTAWLQGSYSKVSVEMGVRNALAAKKKDRISEWVELKDPMEKFSKPKITEDNLENEFRKQQANQQDWLFNR